jgi:hypothetical protein
MAASGATFAAPSTDASGPSLGAQVRRKTRRWQLGIRLLELLDERRFGKGDRYFATASGE